ncbi:MAG: 2-dehydro-3-deoxygalactonokinase [Notoacmeibacter sp.]
MALAAFALVDWGTTNLRVWLVDHAGAVLAEQTTPDGMGTLSQAQFGPVLERVLTALGAPVDLPAMICGMAGSRQGWKEAPYAATPVMLAELALQSVAFHSNNRSIRILPGIARKSSARPDVMRGEETQLLGLNIVRSVQTGLVCLPGTHSKWAKLERGAVTDFVSVMTGELYALLRQHSILRHSTGNEVKVSATDPAFLSHVQIGLSPDGGLGRLFSVRAASLVGSAGAAQSSAALSGLLIGTEIRDASGILGQHSGEIHVIGSNSLSSLYKAALAISGFSPLIQDGSLLVRSGLLSAANQIHAMSIRAAE